MADTLREPTASHHSESSTNGTKQAHLISFGATSPTPSTIPYLIGQETASSTLFIQEPRISLIGNAAGKAFKAHYITNSSSVSQGSTVSLYEGNRLGERLFAVSILPTHTVELNKCPSWRQLFGFALQNADLLLIPGFAMGTWFDQLRGMHVLDVVVCLADLRAAIELGRAFQQKKVYDLANQCEIAVEEPNDR